VILVTALRVDGRSGADEDRPDLRAPQSRPTYDSHPRDGREQSHSKEEDGIAFEVINFAARTGGHVAYAGSFGVGAPIVVRSDTLFSARTWKNEFR
jgi:hypothetical protein